MTGSSLNIINYSNTGTQAQRTYNGDTIEDSVESSFITKKDYTRKLAFGSSLVEIHPSSGSSKLGSAQTFKIPDNIDAVGDIYFNIDFAYKKTAGFTSNRRLTEFGLCTLIKKITVYINGSIYQEFRGADIIMSNFTNLTPGEFSTFYNITRGYYHKDRAFFPLVYFGGDERIEIKGFFKLPIFFNGGVDNSYIKLQNLNDNISLKIEYAGTIAEAFGDTFSFGVYLSSIDTVHDFNVTLFSRIYTIGNLERNLMISNPFAKIHKFNQGVVKNNNDDKDLIKVDLSFVSLLASHISIFGRWRSSEYNAIIEYVELFFDGRSYCGRIPGIMLQVANESPQSQFQVEEGLDSTTFTCYILQLSSGYFSEDGIPFNSYSKIELVIKFNHINLVSGRSNYNPEEIYVTVFGSKSLVYKNGKSSAPF